MAELTPEIVTEVVQTCKGASEQAARAFQRSLDIEVKLSVGEPATLDVQSLPEGLAGGGLAIVLAVGGRAALILVPEGSGLLPSWSADPDPAGRGKLATLAQELGTVLLPEQFAPQAFATHHVSSFAELLRRGGVGDTAAIVPLGLRQPDGQLTEAGLIWPAEKPGALIAAGADQTGRESEPPSKSAPQPRAPANQQTPDNSEPAARRELSVDDLPPYTRSLLRIKVPVVVTLARKRQPLRRIMELGPGSIIQFEKSCDEMLELDVGGRPIATGEAVKVGDKFGLRLCSVVLPEERFQTAKGSSAGNTRSAAAGR